MKFFEPLYYSRPYMSGNTIGFSNLSEHSVEINGIIYPNSDIAIKDLSNAREYKTFDEMVYSVLKAKFDQHPDLKKNLINTGLRPIIQRNYNVKLRKRSCAITGHLLGVLRANYYRNM